MSGETSLRDLTSLVAFDLILFLAIYDNLDENLHMLQYEIYSLVVIYSLYFNANPLLCFNLSALDAPKDLTVVEVTETTMVLEWKRPLAKLDSYRLVYVSADGHRVEDEVPGSFESHTLRGLTPGMLYTISITAERGRRTSVPATISAPTGQC